MLALTHDNAVYSWGYGGDGQTGLGTVLNSRAPVKIEALSRLEVRSIACGANFSMAVTRKGALYAWGYNDEGWLGLQPTQPLTLIDNDGAPPNIRIDVPECACFDSRHNVLVPTLVKAMARYHVESVRCGAAHTVFICSKRAEQGSIESGGEEEEEEEREGKKGYRDRDDDDSSDYSDEEEDSKRGGGSVSASAGSKGGRVSSGAGMKESATAAEAVVSSLSDAEINSQLISWCRHRKLLELQYALSKRPHIDVNIRDNAGNTPLIVSCQNGHVAIVKLLIKHGAGVNLVNNKGNTALHYSFAFGFEEISQYLLEQGADDLLVNSEGLTCYEGLTAADLERL